MADRRVNRTRQYRVIRARRGDEADTDCIISGNCYMRNLYAPTITVPSCVLSILISVPSAPTAAVVHDLLEAVAYIAARKFSCSEKKMRRSKRRCGNDTLKKSKYWGVPNNCARLGALYIYYSKTVKLYRDFVKCLIWAYTIVKVKVWIAVDLDNCRLCRMWIVSPHHNHNNLWLRFWMNLQVTMKAVGQLFLTVSYVSNSDLM